MRDFGVALGLVLVLEGLIWAAFPHGMRKAMAQAEQSSPGLLRILGLGAATVGLVVIWIVRWRLD